MSERKAFIDEWLGRDESLPGPRCVVGISRKASCQRVDRFRADGGAGLSDAARRPHNAVEAFHQRAVEAPAQLRRKDPGWGPRQLLTVLATANPDLSLPSHSTVSRRFAPQGLRIPEDSSQA